MDVTPWNGSTSDPGYYNNCTASRDEFMAVIDLAGCRKSHVHVFAGWFDETFPELAAPPIAVLRLDADWYDSTMTCLEKFWESVLPEGAILIDDYYTWDGCSRAVHDFLSSRKAIERISQESANLAVIIKQS